MNDKTGPVLIELDADEEVQTPAEAPAVPDAAAPDGQAMQTVVALAARKPSRLARWFWSLLLSVVLFFVSLAAWNAITALLAANPVMGFAATILVTAFALVALLVAFKELAAFLRLGRMDRLHQKALAAASSGSLAEAKEVAKAIGKLYAGRPELRPGTETVTVRMDEVFEAEALLGLTEREVLAPLDAAALREAEAAARQVATVTALVPLALADVVSALTANLRMIRRIGEIYGGRSGTIGSWRLARAVMGHLVATGAVAVGDDLLGSVAGGSILSKLSRRFGEGLVNGALTARVGIAAIEVCRPLPFQAVTRPSVAGLITRALTGVFDRKDANGNARD
ncbi:YcjF family protein [Shimia ponticola]|uniref:YcjF family protein n=1 Tax=Shimia ponticola TaxID=2582893 RepID=UPI0011BE99C3|nr:TIGR01620 family protein [Shimia ponticola]